MNIAFHNLCHHTQLPQGIHDLLGLGLKCCLMIQHASLTRPYKSLFWFQFSVHLHLYFKDKAKSNSDLDSVSSDPDSNVKYIPSPYIPSDWNPPMSLIWMLNEPSVNSKLKSLVSKDISQLLASLINSSHIHTSKMSSQNLLTTQPHHLPIRTFPTGCHQLWASATMGTIPLNVLGV
jgi:hypothetical protein